MTENSSGISGFFSNKFGLKTEIPPDNDLKKEDVQGSLNLKEEAITKSGDVNIDVGGNETNEEEEEESNIEGSAINHLIYHSFFPSTVMVHLDENIISVRETVPDLMKAKEQDLMLQETIKMFHSLMQEKDDEILNLRKQMKELNIDGSSKVTKVVSSEVQTDLTLDECNQMENQLITLSGELPQRVETISILQKEKDELEKSNKEMNKQILLLGKMSSFSKSISADNGDDPKKLEDELNDAYKNLLELEEMNSKLTKQNEELNKKLLELGWQFDDVSDLKMEIEQAKIEVEEDIVNLKDQLMDKNNEISKLKENLKALEEYDREKITMITPVVSGKLNTEKKVSPSVPLVRQASAKSLQMILRDIKSMYGKDNLNDEEFIKEICIQGTDPNTKRTEDLLKCCAILNVLEIDENGHANLENLLENYQSCVKSLSKLPKERLIEESSRRGFDVILKEAYGRQTPSELYVEYQNLDTILHLMNKNYKRSTLSQLKELSRKILIKNLLERKRTIFQISLTEFWNVVLDKTEKEPKYFQTITINSNTQNVLIKFLYQTYQSIDEFGEFVNMLIEIRNTLLTGQPHFESITIPESLLFQKFSTVHMMYDITSHILPKYPDEIRFECLNESIEESIFNTNLLIDKMSPTFLEFIAENSSDLANKTRYPKNVFWYILDIFSLLNFEEDLFEIEPTNKNSKLKTFKLSKSVSRNKHELTEMKMSLKKLTSKEKLILRAQQIHNIQNVETDFKYNESLKCKSENELIKILVDTKAKILKLIFIESFSPLPDKLVHLTQGVCYSSVDGRFMNLDFYLKTVLDQYYKAQLNALENYKMEDIRIGLKRLRDCFKILNAPVEVDSVTESESKIKVAELLFKTRFLLKLTLESSLFGKRNLAYLMVNNSSLMNFTNSNSFGQIRDLFLEKTANLQSKDIQNVVKHLYEIDCIIFPGWSDDNSTSKNFSKLTDKEVAREIVLLRLILLHYSSCGFNSVETDKSASVSNILKYDSIKQLKEILVKLEPTIISESVVKMEQDECKELSRNLSSSSGMMNDAMLVSAFAELNTIKSSNKADSSKMADNSMSLEEFRKLSSNQKVKTIKTEVDKLLNKSVPNEVKVERTSDAIVGKEVSELFGEIMKLINDKSKNEEIKANNDIIKYLTDILQWVKLNKEWSCSSHTRLNNLVKKLNTKSNQDRRVARTSDMKSELDETNGKCGGFEDEKAAFEKSFAELEQRINEIPVRDTGNNYTNATIELNELKDKSVSELHRLVLSAEKELAGSNWDMKSEREAQEWLESRSKDELMDDCRGLMHKLTVMKMNALIVDGNNEPVKKPGLVKRRPKTSSSSRSEKPTKDDRLTALESDIDTKLAAYQELCQTVENLKVPQRMSKNDNKSGSLKNLSGYQAPSPIQETRINNEYKAPLNSAVNRNRFDQTDYQTPHHEEETDQYFQKRLLQLQGLLNSQYAARSTVSNPKATYKIHSSKECDILVDGFDIEEEKSPRYYSMRLQDMQHERTEDEMGAILHHLQQHQRVLSDENKALSQKVYLAENIVATQASRIELLEKAGQLFKQRNKPFNDDSEIIFLQEENRRICSALSAAETQMDSQNHEIVTLVSENNNLKHENHDIIIKNQHLERNIRKTEETYKELVQQLELERSRSQRAMSPAISDQLGRDFTKAATSGFTTELEDKLRRSERDKAELVRKLDMIDQQNRLVKDRCEKLDNDLIRSHKKLGDERQKAATYRSQLESISQDVSQSSSRLTRSKDDEISRLRSQILTLETRLATSAEPKSHEKLKEELINQKEKEIIKLRQEIGTFRDLLEEAKAQLDVKDYETRKLTTANRQLQNQFNDSSYFPPPGYKLIRDE